MLELIQEILRPYHLPFTILLPIVLAYCIFALIGFDAATTNKAILVIFSIFLLGTSLLANQSFNPDSAIKTVIISVNLIIIISFIFTRLSTRPLAPLTRLHQGSEPDAPTLGTKATVTTSSITQDFGRIEFSSMVDRLCPKRTMDTTIVWPLSI